MVCPSCGAADDDAPGDYAAWTPGGRKIVEPCKCTLRAARRCARFTRHRTAPARPNRTALGSYQDQTPTNKVSTVHSKITSGDVFESDPVTERLQLLSQTRGLAARIHG